MYLEAGLIGRLVLLPFLYFLSIFFLWETMGIYIFLIGWFPLVINTLLFSSPFFNYFSTILFSFVTLVSIGASVESVFYDPIFWGMQAVVICLLICISIIQNRFIPQNTVTKQKHIDRFFRYKDNIIVEYDIRLHTVIAISDLACTLYQWNKKYLIGKPLTLIHLDNFILNPPPDFWISIQRENFWHGFSDIIMKDGTICEERAYYKAYKNRNGEIVSIEKKVMEILLKTEGKKAVFQYDLFFEDSPIPLAIINDKGIIEKANPIFIKEVSSKPIFRRSRFSDLFIGDQKEQIAVSLDLAFRGERTSFMADFDSVNGYIYCEYMFIPYFDLRYRKISHVFFLLRKVNMEALSVDKNKLNLVKNETIEVLRVLKESLTDIYKSIPNNQLKVFGNTLPIINGSCDLWKKLCDSILMFALKESSTIPNITTISCNSIHKHHFFKVVFNGISYQNLPFLEKSLTMQMLRKIVSLISSDIVFRKGNSEELVLTFSIQE